MRVCLVVAGVTGLEPAASGVTGRRSNQLSYTPLRRLYTPLRRPSAFLWVAFLWASLGLCLWSYPVNLAKFPRLWLKVNKTGLDSEFMKARFLTLLRISRQDLRGWQFRVLGVVAVLLADQASKVAAIAALQVGESVQLLPFFSLTLTGNPGIAFSRLGGVGPLLLVLLSGTITLFFLIWMLRVGRAGTALRGALVFIVGGALGNLADRVRYGEVVDFLHLHAGGKSFPVFNLADTALTIGAILLITDFLMHLQQEPQ